jgi:8-oxo-dGTP pyrophosphatase MutT (NUDIX family)
MQQSQVDARFSICLLEDKSKRLLFIKRSISDAIGPGKWGFPAGHIEDGESPMECALREMNEEIGPEHKISELNILGPVRDTFYGGKFEIHLFHFRWISGEIILNDEHTEFAWVAANEFVGLDTMLGVEEDIVLLNIWPSAIFNQSRLPSTLLGD